MATMQQHLDIFAQYIAAYGLESPSQEQIDSASAHITKYDPIEDGLRYLEIPQAAAEMLITVFYHKNIIGRELKKMLLANLREMKRKIDEQGKVTSKNALRELLEKPEPSDEVKDMIRTVETLESLAWNAYRRFLVDAKVCETGQVSMGIRKTHDGGFAILALPEGFEAKEDIDDDSGELAKKVSGAIGEIVSDLEDDVEGGTRIKSPTYFDMRSGAAGRLDDIMNKFGISDPKPTDDKKPPKNPDSPNQ